MGWNNAYWRGKNQRAEKALLHHKEMLEKYPVEIENSVNNTVIYSDGFRCGQKDFGNPNIIVENLDSVSAVLKYAEAEKKTVVLNFASYKIPGGGFLKGSSAQEESLCMESCLYEVLSDEKLKGFYEWNNQHKNKSLYTNRALYSTNVSFIRNDTIVKADVLTCASPNRKAYMDYISGADEMVNFFMLDQRITFIHDILSAQKNLGTVILGAFGCGVFGQDPATVAQMFKDKMYRINADRIVYAVIDKGGHSKEGAFSIFKRIMEAQE